MTRSEPHLAADSCVSTARPPTVLVVEDDDTLRAVLARVLRQRGFGVWAAATGDEAVELYRRLAGRIDVVLSDVNMPGMNGPEVLSALRAAAPHVRCCFMTADARPETRAELLACGGCAVIAKPFASLDGVCEPLRTLAVVLDGG